MRNKVGTQITSFGFEETEPSLLPSWEIFCNDFRDAFNKKNKKWHWKVEVENFGWRKQSGHTYIHTVHVEQFFSRILPNTECHLKVFHYKNGFAIQNFHHDSPVGDEWYYAVPCAESTYMNYKRNRI